MANNVQINLTTKYNGKGFRKFRQDAKSAAQKAGDVFDQFGVQMGSLDAFKSITRGAVNFSVESVKAADQARAVETAFVNLSGGAEKARANMVALDKATRDLVSETEQQQIANQLLGMNIVDTSAELEKVVGVSRRLGKEFRGLGARDAAEEFALMISNMSVARLDSFGISSGRVRERIDELMETTEGMNREQAFFQATMEEADKVLKRLGPETETLSDSMASLQAHTQEFKVAMGELASDGGIILFLDGMAQWLTQGAEAWGFMIREITGAEQPWERVTEVAETNTEAIKTNSDALEENAERQKEVAEIRRDTARELIDIDEQATESVEETWQDYFKAEAELWEDTKDRITDIRKDFAKDIIKIDRDLAKNLERDARKLQRDLAKVDRDETKKIEEIKKKSVQEQRNDEKRRQVDALADERLFNFELRQLAAEGQANQIRQLLERRAIEEQIAKEKAQVEASIEQQATQDEIQRVRDAAQERRDELRADSEERQSLRIEDAEEAKELRQLELSEQLADEAKNYQDRLTKLRQHREEKLTEIEESKQESVEALARELAEMGELTESELSALATTAGKLGEEYGAAFASGIAQGYATNDQIMELLASPLSGGASAGFGANPSTIGGTPGFANGVTNFSGGRAIAGEAGPEVVHLPRGSSVSPSGSGVNVEQQADLLAEIIIMASQKVQQEFSM